MNALQIIVLILVLCWLGGIGFHLGGDLIHLLIVIALVILVFDLLRDQNVL